jgi:hypothetical protein
MYPGAPPRSLRAVIGGETTYVVAAWVGDAAVLLRSRVPIHDRITPDNGGHLGFIADLAEGPVVLDGPDARWRWQLVRR